MTLTAAARRGSRFTGWHGDCEGRGTCHVRLDDARTVTARFAPAPHTRTLHVRKDGDGRVTGASSAIDCGTVCTAHVKRGARIRLVARANDDATFVGWDGPCTGTGPCELTVRDSVTVTARFDAIQPPETERTLTVTPTGAGSGTVTSTPRGVSCGRRCSATFTRGTTVVMTATAGEGSEFAGWAGPCQGTGSCAIDLQESVTVTARFSARPRLTTSSTGPGAISPACSPPGCSYDEGDVVTLTATPDDGAYLEGWSGCTQAAGDPGACVVTMSADRQVSARFRSNVE